MKHLVSKIACAAIVVVAVTSCHVVPNVIRGRPDFDPHALLAPQVTDDLHLQVVRPSYCIDAFGNATVQIYRDECISSFLGMIDLSYADYRRSLIDIVNGGNLTADILTLGLGTATSLVPGPTTKSIFGGIISGISGTKSAVDADLLYNSAIVTITNQMDIDRATALNTILTRMKSPPPPAANNVPVPSTLSLTTTINVGASGKGTPQIQSTTSKTTPDQPATYSIVDASLDLIQYYESGTFTHALQSLQAKTGKGATDCKQQVTDTKTGTSSTRGSQPTSGSANGC